MRKIIYNEDNAIIDQGIFFGKGVFETILVLNKPVLLNEHMERLKSAVLALNMEPLQEEIESFILALNIKNKALKVTVTDSNIIITDRIIPYTDKDYTDGFKLTFSKVIRNSTSRLTYIKSTCYIENILEKQQAVEKGYNDVIFMNEKGYITETSAANIFFVKNNKIFTPTIVDGLLNGIIRTWIIQNYQVEEKSLTIDEIKKCDEAFITNSLMGVMPVSVIDDKKYKNDKVYKIIRDSYEKMKTKAGG